MISKINKIKYVVFVLGILFGITIFSFSYAATATFIGSIEDDGGDPNLEVWFQYGKTNSYGYETPHQFKYGTGDFSITVSNLENCTTYYYRAVAKHQNYDDIKYGQEKVFSTPCATVNSPSVDIKANGLDGTITIPYNSSVNLTWTSNNVTSCYASGDWFGNKPTSGSETISNLTSGPKTYTITCSGAGGTVSDSVTIYISQTSISSGTVTNLVNPTIQKLVRNLSDGEQVFSKSITADPNEVLEFKIIINARSGAQNVSVKDFIPDKIIIRQNTLKIDGVLTSGDITSGIYLGNLSQNQIKIISFLAHVASADKFSFGDTSLKNNATLYWNGTSTSDWVEITVKKTAVAGAATEVSTGFVKKFFYNYFGFVFIVISLLLYVFKLNMSKIENLVIKTNKKYQDTKSKTFLKIKIAKIKFKDFLRW
jgi:hypothetical protein